MRIIFDQQDLIDAVCVFVAADHNGGFVEDSEPHLVSDIKFAFTTHTFTATARIYGHRNFLNQQKIVDAVALYLSSYYSFSVDRLLINLTWDETTNLFGADIVVER